jgi:hypothetical protein
VFLLYTGLALAETPAAIESAYAAAAGGGFQPSAERGRSFFNASRGVSSKLDACVTCHTVSPEQAGKHAITGRVIAPMSPLVTPTRFSDPAKVEKWFYRNCREVVGRECSPGEKADVLAYLRGSK